VQPECLEHAIVHVIDFRTWGVESVKERQTIRHNRELGLSV
jgi:hypothetical protein